MPAEDNANREVLEIIRRADSFLAEGEFLKASQCYAKSVGILQRSSKSGFELLAAHHHLARSMDAYFNGSYPDAIAAIDPAIKLYSQAGSSERSEFAQALQLIFQARLDSDKSEHRSADSLLNSAEAHLNNVKAVSADLEMACIFWSDWARVQYLFHLLLDQAFDDPDGAAVETIGALRERYAVLKSSNTWTKPVRVSCRIPSWRIESAYSAPSCPSSSSRRGAPSSSRE